MKNTSDVMQGTIRFRPMAMFLILMVSMLTSPIAMAWESYPGFLAPGIAGIEFGDFDGDGTPEAAVTGISTSAYSTNASSLLATLAADANGDLGIRSISQVPWTPVGSMVPAVPEGSAGRLAVASYDETGNQILVLGGNPLRVLRTIQAPMIYAVLAVADVDADGFPEIVALSSSYLYGDSYPVVLDYATGAVKWTGSTICRDVGVAQLDLDPAMELILAGTPGKIIDGSSHAVEWTYPSGFGEQVIVGHFDSDPAVAGFAINKNSMIQIFRSQPFSPVSEFSTNEVAAARTVKLVPGGADEIAIGNGQWGEVAVYDPRTGLALATSPNPEHGVSALAVGDIDGDGHAELIYGAGLTSSGKDILRVVDLVSLEIDYNKNDELGPYSALASGNLDGAGSSQLAYLTVGSNSGYDGSNLHVLDAVTGREIRSRDGVLDSWFRTSPQIAVASMDDDPQMEIVVSGSDIYDGIVAVLDGVTLEDQWRVGGFGSIFGGSDVRSLALLDVNGDDVPDPVVATSTVKIVVLDGSNGSTIWQSVTLSGGSDPTIAAFRNGAEEPRIAIALGTGLYVFNPISHLLEASMKSSEPIRGLRQWGQGTSCRIGALDSQAVVTVYRCNDLSFDTQRLMPEGTVFFRPLDESGIRFVAAAGKTLYQVLANGEALPISGPLGNQLGDMNFGEIALQPDGVHLDAILGSDYMVTRVSLNLDDTIFKSGFE